MKYFLGFLASIVLIVLVFILVLRGFSHHGSKVKEQVVLSQYTNSSMQLQYTVDGPIVAEQDHVGYRITVDRSQVRIDTYKGYQNTITQSKTYENNQQSFDEFVSALDLAGFANGDVNAKTTDEKGQCATGDRFIYEVIGNGSAPSERFWSTSCKQGNFKGNAVNVRQLFQKQIPGTDYGQLTGPLGV